MPTVAPLEAGQLAEAQALLAASCPFDPAAAVAEEKLFGAAPPPHESRALGAWQDGRLIGVAAVSGRWLRLLAVHPDARRRGAGSALLAAAEAQARAWEAPRLRTCDQPGNYLAPGIDARNQAALRFFERHGFGRVAENHNLSVRLVDNEHLTPARADALAAAAAARGYQVRRAVPADAAELLRVAETHFAPPWAFEVRRALGNRPATVHLAVQRATRAIVSFACVDANNRGLGWFGPAGTLPEHRGHGLGQALLVPALLDAAAAGRRETEIAWIGPRRFYESAVEAVSGRRFVVLAKELA